MHSYNHEDFINIIGDLVEVTDGEGNMQTLTVTDVKNGRQDNAEWQSHSILFKGSSDYCFTQGNYQIKHATFAVDNLFLSPKSPTDYEAVLSCKKEAIAAH